MISGFIFFIIPGVWYLIRLFLAPLYVVFQNKSAIDAIGTAYTDSKDHVLPFFQVLIPFVVIGFLLFLLVLNQGQQSPNILLTTLITLATTFGFIFASLVQFRLYTLYIKE